MGYHKKYIPQGVFGESSKIEEECSEFLDAVEQNNKVMCIVELSDLIGAIEGYLENYHPSICLSDLIIMSNATKGAFNDGTRKSKN